MVNVNEEDRKFIIENLENGAELLKSGNVNDVLDALDDLIDEKGFLDENGFHTYDYNDFGRKVQKIFDRIYDEG